MPSTSLITRLRGVKSAFSHKAHAQRLAAWKRDILRESEISVFGAGRNSHLVVGLLDQAGMSDFRLLDDTPSKVGKTLHGHPIMAVEPATRPGQMVVCSIYSPHISFQTIGARLSQLGYRPISMLEFLWTFGGDRLPFYFLDQPEILIRNWSAIEWLAERLVDDRSGDELIGHVSFRLGLDYRVLPPISRLAEDFTPPWTKFGFIDGGAYDGDTLLPFAERFSSRLDYAIGVEPDCDNHAALAKAVKDHPLGATLSMSTLNAALGDHVGTARFASGSKQASRLAEDGDSEIPVTTVTSIAATAGSSLPVVCKVDVEGAEAAVVQGAAPMIEKGTILLALSAYHRPADLWALAQQIDAINSGYRFALRSHGCDGSDSMIYAFPQYAN